MIDLWNMLENYAQSHNYPFHMPGHKGGRLCALKEPFGYDITEIPGFDNLHAPQGILQEAQEKWAALSGADASFLLVNGSTVGNQAAILSVCRQGDTVLIARNCHRSVYSAVALSGAVPVYVYPELIEELGIQGGIAVDKAVQAMENYPQAKALVVTSPTFEGFTSDICSLAKQAHKRGMVLIVDEAHGSHMVFHSYFPKGALECGADYVTQSLHKTLPAMTQTAILHCKGSLFEKDRTQKMLSMLQTSSPSYVLMASMDKCRAFLEAEGKVAFEEYVNRLKAFRQQAKELRYFILLGEERATTHGIFEVDKGKLVFYIAPDLRSCGMEILNILYDSYQIVMEMCADRYFLAITSIADDTEGFDRLLHALLQIEKKIKAKTKKQPALLPKESRDVTGTEPANNPPSADFIEAKYAISPRQALMGQTQAVSLQEAEGQVCAEFIIAYPPGIPLVAPGERITLEIINEIHRFLKIGISLIGMQDPKLNRVLIVKETSQQ